MCDGLQDDLLFEHIQQKQKLKARKEKEKGNNNKWATLLYYYYLETQESIACDVGKKSRQFHLNPNIFRVSWLRPRLQKTPYF